jgi:hypothetical protein
MVASRASVDSSRSDARRGAAIRTLHILVVEREDAFTRVRLVSVSDAICQISDAKTALMISRSSSTGKRSIPEVMLEDHVVQTKPGEAASAASGDAMGEGS